MSYLEILNEELSKKELDFNMKNVIDIDQWPKALKTNLNKLKPKLSGEKYRTKKEQWLMSGDYDEDEWYLNAKVEYPYIVHEDFTIEYDLDILKKEIAKEIIELNDYYVSDFDINDVIKDKNFDKEFKNLLKRYKTPQDCSRINIVSKFDSDQDPFKVIKGEVEVSSSSGNMGEINSVYPIINLTTIDIKCFDAKVSGKTLKLNVRLTSKSDDVELLRDIDFY